MKTLVPIMRAAACAVIMGASSARAGEPTERRIVVSYGDLDVSAPEGAQALIYRLEAAASKVCGGAPDIRMLKAWGNYRACVKDAVDGAVRRVNRPIVSAAYGQPMQEEASR